MSATATLDMDGLAARVRAKREPLGLNVRFINIDGKPDCYSFATSANAERFRAKLIAVGRELLA